MLSKYLFLLFCLSILKFCFCKGPRSCHRRRRWWNYRHQQLQEQCRASRANIRRDSCPSVYVPFSSILNTSPKPRRSSVWLSLRQPVGPTVSRRFVPSVQPLDTNPYLIHQSSSPAQNSSTTSTTSSVALTQQQKSVSGTLPTRNTLNLVLHGITIETMIFVSGS